MSTQQPKPPAPRGTAPRKRGPDVSCLTAYVDAGLARALRIRAATEGRTTSALVGDALASFLEPDASTHVVSEERRITHVAIDHRAALPSALVHDATVGPALNGRRRRKASA